MRLYALLFPTHARRSATWGPRLEPLFRSSSPMSHHLPLPSTACGAVERDLVFEALERDGADRLERHPVAVPLLLYLLAYENFAGPRVIRDSRCDIDCPPEVVAVAKDHASGVDAHTRSNLDSDRRLLHEVKTCQYGSRRVGEVEHHAVAKPLHRPPAVQYSDRVHERG